MSDDICLPWVIGDVLASRREGFLSSLKFVFGGWLVVSKICSHDGGICHCGSCDIILSSGEVICCSRHKNPLGKFMVRRLCASRVSIFDLWLRSVR